METEQGWDIVSGVGVTALAVAAARAVETNREHSIIEDPYAELFVAAADSPMPMPVRSEDLEGMEQGEMWASMLEYAAVRTAVFDDYFRAAAAAGLGQAVLLASGLDSRAFRLEWPGRCTVFEIDQPEVLKFKLEVLDGQGVAPACAHRPVPIDLRNDWAAALVDSGFDPSLPTAWLAEGLLPYLPEDAEDRLFDEVHRLSAPGSRVAVEQVTDVRNLINEDAKRQGAEMGVDVDELIHQDDRTSAEEKLAQRGWRPSSTPADRSAERYGRRIDTDMFSGSHMSHVIAELP